MSQNQARDRMRHIREAEGATPTDGGADPEEPDHPSDGNWYRSAYENTPAISLTTDARGMILNVNRFGAESLGYSVEELTGRPARVLVHPDDHAALEAHLRRCTADEGRVNFIEFRKVRRDGSVLWVREAARSLREADGALVVLSSCEDITERVLAEQALRRSEELFRQIAENIREVFWVSEPDYSRLLYVSPAYQEIWGRSPEPLLRDPLAMLEAVHPEDRERVERSLAGMADGFDLEFRIHRPDGQMRWIHARGYPVRDEAGEVFRAVGVGEDVTDRKALSERESQARMQVTSILERITDAFFALDAEWRFTYLNPGARAAVEGILGSDPSGAVGRSFWDVAPQFRGTRFEEEYHRAMRTQEPAHFEEFMPDFGVWFEVHAYPSPAGLSVYFRDATERRRAEEERAELLRAEQAARAEAERRARDEEALRLAAEAVTAPHRLNEVIQRIALSALDATGADGAYVERFDGTRHCVEVVAVAGGRVPEVGLEVPYGRSAARVAVEQRSPLSLVRLADVDHELPGELKHACGSCSAVVVPLGDPEDAVGALTLLRAPERPAFAPADLGRAGTFARLATLAFRRAQILEESESRRVELEQVMESRAHLIRGFSHDLKNPLGAADGYLALLEDGLMGEMSAKQLESIGRVRRSIRSALTLINDLVELARAESGQIELNPGPLAVRETVLELAEEFRAQAEAKRLSLRCAAAEPLPILVADGQRVRQVLGNLLSNAIKYTPEGGSVRVAAMTETPGTEQDPSWVVISVEDTGPGVPAAKQEEIFREFTRLASGDVPGAGLGLAISRRIARALGGDIRVDSEEGRGSRFTLWLPGPEQGP